MLRNFLMLFACASLVAARSRRAQTSPIPAADYKVAKSWRIGGNNAWDTLALEASGGRLFVTRDDHVDVIETVSGKLTGNIPRTAGVHAIAFAPALKRGFTSNGRSNSVSVFELDTLRVAYEVPDFGHLARRHSLRAAAKSHFHRQSGKRESFGARRRHSASRGHRGAARPPESMATDEAGHVYVNINTAPGRLVLIDAKSLMVKAKWLLKECAGPTAIAIDVMNHRLFSVCANQVMAVTDSVSGKAIAQVVIGRGSDGAVFDPELGLAFSSNGIDGTLTVIHQDSPDEYRVIATVTTQVSARTMALDPATHKIYLAAAQFGPPPAASEDQPRARATVVPDSFLILVAQPK